MREGEQPRRVLPEDPLGFIQRCIRQGKLRWTYHINMRLRQRHVPREAILGSLDSFEIIESYPGDQHLPSYLIYSEYEGVVFHVVIATDVPDDNVRLVTAYKPDPQRWEEDLKTRRQTS